MVKFTLKNTAIIIVILAYLGNVVKSQKQEKTEVRSLGHRRGGVVGEQTVFVDRPYFVEQPLYYPYPYQYPYTYTYQYPYTYTYTYPYTYQYQYPYNYSYSYTRTTSRPGVLSHPVGYMPPPYAPLPAPYLRYLGNDPALLERKMDAISPMETVTPGFINDLSLQDGILGRNENLNNDQNNANSQNPPQQTQNNQTLPSGTKNDGMNNFVNRDGINFDRFPALSGLNRMGLADGEREMVKDRDDDDDDDDDDNDDNDDHDKNVKNNSLYNQTSVSGDAKKYNTTMKTPEIVYFNNTSNLRVLAKKGLLERVEEKVNDVFDGIKKKINTNDDNDDQLSDLEKEDSNDNEKDNDKKKNSNKKTQNGNKMVKQVFSTIEDIVTNTLNK
ncbi:uncharacterized protein cubi_00427 [Cryptosporidium ubiquitum]|uniref:Uncharacterized protein n=1 Tax=Cryptosporidium ubiquitum TaxID=857276 RepID=A0A1J4MDX7_9CRYT|nr:uncharacterized protein cubi_00427 [Cryptosporidium ubiquitum]OII72432.1 hypothetical protein cubi_00427 [Cryptosporidium ubiquitum]